MKKLTLLLIALLCCVAYSCSNDDGGPVNVGYRSGTFSHDGKLRLTASVDGETVTTGNVKLSVDTHKQKEGIMQVNDIVPGNESVTVNVSIRKTTVDNPDEHTSYYRVEGFKTLGDKTYAFNALMMTRDFSEKSKSLALTVTTE